MGSLDRSGMNVVFLLLGSNEGDRAFYLAEGLKKIEEKIGTLLRSSSIYETKAWGNEDQPPFLNQVILAQTYLGPKAVLEEIQILENSLGRKRDQKWGPRTIDIDILFYNDLVLEKKELVIPHAGITKRRFTLVPLNEIASEYLHPKFNLTINELLHQCKDGLQVEKWTGDLEEAG